MILFLKGGQGPTIFVHDFSWIFNVLTLLAFICIFCMYRYIIYIYISQRSLPGLLHDEARRCCRTLSGECCLAELARVIYFWAKEKDVAKVTFLSLILGATKTEWGPDQILATIWQKFREGGRERKASGRRVEPTVASQCSRNYVGIKISIRHKTCLHMSVYLIFIYIHIPSGSPSDDDEQTQNKNPIYIYI